MVGRAQQNYILVKGSTLASSISTLTVTYSGLKDVSCNVRHSKRVERTAKALLPT